MLKNSAVSHPAYGVGYVQRHYGVFVEVQFRHASMMLLVSSLCFAL